MRFAEPAWLLAIVLAPLPWLLAHFQPRITWPTLAGFASVGRFSANVKASFPFLLRGLAIICLAVALARPRVVAGFSKIAGQGVAIVVAVDQSSSMNTTDFPVTKTSSIARLDAARRTLSRFVAGRPDDLIGLVIFANYPDLVCPPTFDHHFLLDTVRSIRSARPGDDGTNLGDAMVWGVDALRESSPKKKVLVLITDGRNSPAVPRPTDPIQAAEIARAMGITVHTIAIGAEAITRPEGDHEADGPDLALLGAVAKAGGGQSFQASDTGSLDRVFQEIDTLEKSPVRGRVRTRYRDVFAPWAASALAFLLVDRLVALRRLP